MNEQRESAGTDRDISPPGASHAPNRGSVWSYIALLVALSCALSMLLAPDIPSGLAFAWMPLTLFGIAAGIVGVVRDQRILWSAIAALSALICLIATGAPSLFLSLLIGF